MFCVRLLAHPRRTRRIVTSTAYGLGDDVSAIFAVEDEIGRGAFGVVYRGRCLQSGRAVAIKKVSLLPPRGWRGAGANPVREMLLEEVSILRSVRSPHVVSLLNYVEDGCGHGVAVVLPDDLLDNLRGVGIDPITGEDVPVLPPQRLRLLLSPAPMWPLDPFSAKRSVAAFVEDVPTDAPSESSDSEIDFCRRKR